MHSFGLAGWDNKAEQMTKDGEESRQRKAETDNATAKAQKARLESDKAAIESLRAINRLETARTEFKKLELDEKQANLNQRVIQADLKFSSWTNKALVWSIVVTVVLFSVLFIAIAIHEDLLKHLEVIAKARGLITFTIATGTIIIALILVLVTLLGSWPDSQERFNRGKEVLAILVGVLGTIVGYYYGAADNSGGSADTPPTVEEAPSASR